MSSRSSSSSSSLSVSLETKRTVHRGKLCLLETLDERERERVRKGEKAMENKEMAEPDGNSTSVEWCRVVPMVRTRAEDKGDQRNLRYFVPIVVRGFRLLTIRAGETGSFFLVVLPTGSCLPLPRRKRLSLNYERGTRLNSTERTKGRFKLNARLFHLYLVLLPVRPPRCRSRHHPYRRATPPAS